MTAKTLVAALAFAAILAAVPCTQSEAAASVQPAAPATTSVAPGIELAQYHVHRRGPVIVRPPMVRPGPAPRYRRWVRRPYFGSVIAGVALGTILTAAAVGAPPPPPAPNLCWYWADRSLTRGYWDYCQ